MISSVKLGTVAGSNIFVLVAIYVLKFSLDKCYDLFVKPRLFKEFSKVLKRLNGNYYDVVIEENVLERMKADFRLNALLSIHYASKATFKYDVIDMKSKFDLRDFISRAVKSVEVTSETDKYPYEYYDVELNNERIITTHEIDFSYNILFKQVNSLFKLYMSKIKNILKTEYFTEQQDVDYFYNGFIYSVLGYIIVSEHNIESKLVYFKDGQITRYGVLVKLPNINYTTVYYPTVDSKGNYNLNKTDYNTSVDKPEYKVIDKSNISDYVKFVYTSKKDPLEPIVTILTLVDFLLNSRIGIKYKENDENAIAYELFDDIIKSFRMVYDRLIVNSDFLQSLNLKNRLFTLYNKSKRLEDLKVRGNTFSIYNGELIEN